LGIGGGGGRYKAEFKAFEIELNVKQEN
ncbi:unnamed protein product, partial [Rotaria magnacalcarata]